MTVNNITREMIETAQKKGWNQQKAARLYGVHRTSIYHAAKRFGLEWPSRHAPTPKAVQSVPVPRARFSASPKAVARYLEARS